MPTFYHSGSLGDQIYSIPTIRALGGGAFVSGMPMGAYAAMYPLLKAQPLIHEVFHRDHVNLPSGWVDLSMFRNHPLFTRQHIAHLHAEMQQVKVDLTIPWLRVPEYNEYPCRSSIYAVVSVTPRYRDRFFTWDKEIMWLRKHVNTVYYIGDENEFLEFLRDLKHETRRHIYYLSTKTLLHAAQLIKNAEYFSGNQSVCLAIRQGFALPWRFEQSPNHRDTEQATDMETKLNPYTRRLHLAIVCAKRALIDNQYKRIG